MPKYEAFLAWLPKQNPRIHAEVRVYEVPPGGFEDWCDDGEPDQDWVWMCNAQIEPHLVLIRGARSKPVYGTLRALLDLSRTFSPNIDWARRKSGKLVSRRRTKNLPGNSAGVNERKEMSAVKYRLEVKIIKYQEVPVSVEHPTGLVHEHDGGFGSNGLSETDVAQMQGEAIPKLLEIANGFIKKDEPSEVNGGTKGD